MGNIRDDDWIVFFDADTIVTTHDYGHMIEKAIKENQDASAFTCLTNRVWRKWQLADVDWWNDDMKYHRRIGEELKSKYGSLCLDVTENDPMSGMMFALSKQAFNEIGLFPDRGMLGIDQWLHKRIRDKGLRIFQMRGLYIYHWYRGGQRGKQSAKHLTQ